MNELQTMRAVDFDWATQLKQVWKDVDWDVPDLHPQLRRTFTDKLDEMAANCQAGRPSPLGWVMRGASGSGKTHLLSVFRREAAAKNAGFVLVDMTDVKDFWSTVLQGYIDSLQEVYRDGMHQHQCLLRNFLQRLPFKDEVGKALAFLAHRKCADLANDIQKVLNALARTHRAETHKYHNVIRALVCLNSEDFLVANIGMTWLQGQELDPEDQKMLRFTVPCEKPLNIVQALSWLMSLNGPTVLAFDQLDPIVTQLSAKEEAEQTSDEHVARAIIEHIGGGLSALFDKTFNTLPIISCVENTWDVICNTVLNQYVDRFESPWQLSTVRTGVVAEAVVISRLAEAFRTKVFSPPYPTWPFKPEAFEELRNDTPREILKKCDQHRKNCLRSRKISELTSFGAVAPDTETSAAKKKHLQRLDEEYRQLSARANTTELLAEKCEDEHLAPILRSALQCLVRETPLPDAVDGIVDVEFSGGTNTKPLHARLRLVFHQENGREEHFSVRAIQRIHHSAFQSRLNAAMTQSGIDKKIHFRHLAVVRSTKLPGGNSTKKLVHRFEEAGGRFLRPWDYELRSMCALHEMKQKGDPEFDDWLRARRPVSNLELLRSIVPSPLIQKGKSDVSKTRPQDGPPAPDNQNELASTSENVSQTDCSAVTSGQDDGKAADKVAGSTKPLTPAKIEDGGQKPRSEDAEVISPNGFKINRLAAPLGRRLIAGKAGEPVEIPMQGLQKHTVVLAGAGSGKTMLLKRLIEEVGLRGTPSIVIDCANDLAALDERWPQQPQPWNDEDVHKAQAFHQSTEVVIWTPGNNNGNPLTLQPLPDLGAVADDPQELSDAVAMVCDSLGEIVAKGTSNKANNKRGVLSRSLRYFAKKGGGSLEEYMALLDDLPPEAGLGVANEAKLAKEMADMLKVEREVNPLLRSTGMPLDPAVLFGDDKPNEKTRISVINFVGLPTLESQRYFLNQLAMTLFAWLKRNPNPGERDLRGLLVIDEAKDFVPSQKSSVCKDSLARLTAQARKYHLGLLFATQNPKDIDSKIIGNCSTQFYGKANSPASIDVVQEQLKLKGVSGADIPTLPAGNFYVYSTDANLKSAAKVISSICLSHHPKDPLDQEKVLQKAAAARNRLCS